MSARDAETVMVSYAAAHRPVRYTIDLLSPAELQLLRRAVVVRQDEDEVVVAFELTELPA